MEHIERAGIHSGDSISVYPAQSLNDKVIATLEDYTGLSKDDLKMLLKYMTNNHLVDKFKGDYRRLPLGTELFENLTTVPITKAELEAARKDFYSSADV